MIKRKLHGVTIECIQGNIASQPGMDVVVNAANAELRIGGGVAGAIHRAAGSGLEEECRPLAPIRPGQAVITGGHGVQLPGGEHRGPDNSESIERSVRVRTY